MKKDDVQVLGLLLLTLLVTCITFTVGCANVKRMLFEPATPVLDGTNSVPQVQVRQAVTDAVQGVGALAGPSGVAAGGLVLGVLGLVAALLNRATLSKHAARLGAPAPAGTGNKGPPTT